MEEIYYKLNNIFNLTKKDIYPLMKSKAKETGAIELVINKGDVSFSFLYEDLEKWSNISKTKRFIFKIDYRVRDFYKSYTLIEWYSYNDKWSKNFKYIPLYIVGVLFDNFNELYLKILKEVADESRVNASK